VYEDDEGLVWLSCRNCVLVLGPSGPLPTDHDPKYRFTAQLAAAYVPRADAPRLYTEIQHGALPDPLDRAQVDTFGGYCLIPDCRLQTGLVPYGETGIGKSTLFSAHAACLGERLVGRISLANLCGDTSFYLPTLRQFGLNIGRELKASGQKLPPLNADRLREIIDGCPIDTRRAHHDPMRLHHHTKFVFTSNEIPVLRGGNEADARRLRFCHFRVRPEQEDVTLEGRLAAERDSILSRVLVPAACRILAGEKIPQGGQSSIGMWNRFRILNDPLGAFVYDCCDLRTNSAVEKGRLYDRYVAWRKEIDQPSEERPDEFFKRLYGRFGVSATRPGSRGAREHWVRGIGLRDPPR
jgi:phage/plasmid-associated DNA primase